MLLNLRFIMMFIVLLTGGCATGISQEVRSQVTYLGSFSELRANIDQYGGEVVMLGGKVIETQGSPTGSEISVLQLALDRRGRPKDVNQSEGRYLIRSGQFFDPAVYERGALLTVVGTLRGSEVRPVGGFQYHYPIVEAIEVKPWPREQSTSPRFHFGVGVGTSF